MTIIVLLQFCILIFTPFRSLFPPILNIFHSSFSLKFLNKSDDLNNYSIILWNDQLSICYLSSFHHFIKNTLTSSSLSINLKWGKIWKPKRLNTEQDLKFFQSFFPFPTKKSNSNEQKTIIENFFQVLIIYGNWNYKREGKACGCILYLKCSEAVIKV